MVGDAAGYVEVSSLKGIHYAMLSGIAAARQIFASLKSGDNSEAGLAGYLVKSCETEEVVRAVRAAAEGQVYLSPAAAALVVDRWAGRGPAPADGAAAAPTLTRREREVLQLVAEGHSTKQIARVLGVSVKTVESHRHQITRRLHLHSIAELTKYAVRHGLTTLDA